MYMKSTLNITLFCSTKPGNDHSAHISQAGKQVLRDFFFFTSCCRIGKISTNEGNMLWHELFLSNTISTKLHGTTLSGCWRLSALLKGDKIASKGLFTRL